MMACFWSLIEISFLFHCERREKKGRGGSIQFPVACLHREKAVY
jgi:hypothetical protein